MQFDDESVVFAMRLADTAANISRRYFRHNLPIDTKAGNFPVTKADLEIELALRQMIKARYPAHTIIGEEYAIDAGETGGYSWVLDPIDGTTAFTMGKPTFTTLIALTRNNKPILGIIDQAITGERFIGINDVGAYQGIVPASVIPADARVWEAGIPCPNTINYQPIKSGQIRNLSDARLNATTPYMFTADEMVKFNRLKSQVRVCAWGGDAYAYAMLASGYIDLIMEAQLQYYDVAALASIIGASGGIITTWRGEQITPDFSGQCLAAANSDLHGQALKIIND